MPCMSLQRSLEVLVHEQTRSARRKPGVGFEGFIPGNELAEPWGLSSAFVAPSPSLGPLGCCLPAHGKPTEYMPLKGAAAHKAHGL